MLATGGVAGTKFNDLSKPVRAAEIWNPQSGTWRTVASNAVTRGYHGTSILLPDGRVLNAGSGDTLTAPRQLNAELFSPPYLFAGPRPTIGSAPTTVSYDTTFRVVTPDAADDRQGQPDPPRIDDARVRQNQRFGAELHRRRDRADGARAEPAAPPPRPATTCSSS